MSEGELIRVVDVQKSYWVGGQELQVLQDINFHVQRGELLVISGESGVGKSTLLHLLGCLDRPTRGRVFVGGVDISELNGDNAALYRNRFVGYVFQFHYLLPEFTALENVMLPALIARWPKQRARDQAVGLLRDVELFERLEHKPGQLSGGEQQRVAIARALMVEPALLLADEPTGNLDPRTSETVHSLLRRIITERKLTCVAVSHKEGLANIADRVLTIQHGRVSEAKPMSEEN